MVMPLAAATRGRYPGDWLAIWHPAIVP